MNANDVYRALYNRFSDTRQYAVATEVGLSTGGSRRRIDMVVVNCYASNDFRIDGIEVKVSKADLRRELEDPDKHVAFFDLIDYYTLACPEGIADLSLLPPKWGLLVVSDDGRAYYRRKPLALHDSVDRTVPRGFFAGYVRAIQQYSPSAKALAAEYDRGVKDGIEREKRHMRYQQERLSKEVGRLEQLDQLERRFNLWGGDYEKNLDEFERFRSANPDWAVRSIKNTISRLEDLLKVFGGDAE